MNSSDWCAKEKECNDSEGNRLRSSVKFKEGDVGPGGMAIEVDRGFGKERVMELDLGPIEGFRDDDPELGATGVLGSGCWRIRRRPEAPRPCSCSVIIGDLEENVVSHYKLHSQASKTSGAHRTSPLESSELTSNHIPPGFLHRRKIELDFVRYPRELERNMREGFRYFGSWE